MAGHLHALLLGAPLAGTPAVPLAPETGLVLIPLDTTPDDEPVLGFYELTAETAETARVLSRSVPVAYVHMEFFGGTGFHAAAGWRDGALAWGPEFTANAPAEAADHYVLADREEMAINRVLRWLGVRKADAIDEYAAAGLTRHRYPEDWAE